MAPVAIATKIAAMDIVLAVTVATALADADFFFNRVPVAGDTFKRSMRSLKLEFCPGIVIEQPEVPAIRIMAGRAILPQSLFMAIVLAVATSTVA